MNEGGNTAREQKHVAFRKVILKADEVRENAQTLLEKIKGETSPSSDAETPTLNIDSLMSTLDSAPTKLQSCLVEIYGILNAIEEALF